jgi:hypothetical protein
VSPREAGSVTRTSSRIGRAVKVLAVNVLVLFALLVVIEGLASLSLFVRRAKWLRPEVAERLRERRIGHGHVADIGLCHAAIEQAPANDPRDEAQERIGRHQGGAMSGWE